MLPLLCRCRSCRCCQCCRCCRCYCRCLSLPGFSLATWTGSIPSTHIMLATEELCLPFPRPSFPEAGCHRTRVACIANSPEENRTEEVSLPAWWPRDSTNHTYTTCSGHYAGRVRTSTEPRGQRPARSPDGCSGAGRAQHRDLRCRSSKRLVLTRGWANKHKF